MATPNYSFEKRQRELAKKRKAEEKRQKKLTRPGEPGGDVDDGQAQAQPTSPTEASKPPGA